MHLQRSGFALQKITVRTVCYIANHHNTWMLFVLYHFWVVRKETFKNKTQWSFPGRSCKSTSNLNKRKIARLQVELGQKHDKEYLSKWAPGGKYQTHTLVNMLRAQLHAKTSLGVCTSARLLIFVQKCTKVSHTQFWGLISFVSPTSCWFSDQISYDLLGDTTHWAPLSCTAQTLAAMVVVQKHEQNLTSVDTSVNRKGMKAKKKAIIVYFINNGLEMHLRLAG